MPQSFFFYHAQIFNCIQQAAPSEEEKNAKTTQKKGINQCSDKEMSNVYFLTHFMRFVYARLDDKAKFFWWWMNEIIIERLHCCWHGDIVAKQSEYVMNESFFCFRIFISFDWSLMEEQIRNFEWHNIIWKLFGNITIRFYGYCGI